MKNALSEPCVASALSSARRVTSTGETSRRAIRPRKLDGGHCIEGGGHGMLAPKDFGTQP